MVRAANKEGRTVGGVFEVDDLARKALVRVLKLGELGAGDVQLQLGLLDVLHVDGVLLGFACWGGQSQCEHRRRHEHGGAEGQRWRKHAGARKVENGKAQHPLRVELQRWRVDEAMQHRLEYVFQAASIPCDGRRKDFFG